MAALYNTFSTVFLIVLIEIPCNTRHSLLHGSTRGVPGRAWCRMRGSMVRDVRFLRSNYANTAPNEMIRNLVKLNRKQIVFTILRVFWNQMDVRLVINQLENGKYSLISVWFDKISKRFLCVCGWASVISTHDCNLSTTLSASLVPCYWGPLNFS